MSNVQVPKLEFIDSDQVMAFAKLEGDDFDFYLQNLEISIGRKYHSKIYADVPLGFSDAISKFHGQIFYNVYNTRYEFVVTGKSGAHVQGKFVRVGTTAPLEHNTEIVIADVRLTFILPNPNKPQETATIEASIMESTSNLNTDISLQEMEPKIKIEEVDQPDDLKSITMDIEQEVRSVIVSVVEEKDKMDESSDEFDQDNNTSTSNYGQYTENNGGSWQHDTGHNIDDSDVLGQGEQQSDLCKKLDELKFDDKKSLFPLYFTIIYVYNLSNTDVMDINEMISRIYQHFPYYKLFEQSVFKTLMETLLSKVRGFCVPSSTSEEPLWALELDEKNMQKFQALLKSVLRGYKMDVLDENDSKFKFMDRFAFKEDKPPHFMYALIAYVFLRSHKSSMYLNEIAAQLCTFFPYFKKMPARELKINVAVVLKSQKQIFIPIKLASGLNLYNYVPDSAFESKIEAQQDMSDDDSTTLVVGTTPEANETTLKDNEKIAKESKNSPSSSKRQKTTRSLKSKRRKN